MVKRPRMYRKTILENGVRILSETLDSIRSVSLGIWINVGSRDEDKRENGISHFIEHMIFKGTRNRTGYQIAKELDAIGGISNAFTGKENTCFHGRVLGKHLPELSDILSDIFLRSSFDPGDMDRERQVILQEISMVEDSPDENVHDLFGRLFWVNHPIGRPVQGTGESVSAIGKEDMLRYMIRSYASDRIAIVAAGNIDHDALVSHFAPLFESLDKPKSDNARVAPRSNPGLSMHFKDLEQVHLCLGAEAPSQRSDKRFACAVLNAILGGNMSSRLFQEIREKRGLAYAVYSFLSLYSDTGLIGVYVATDPQNVNPVMGTIRKELERLGNGDLSADDVSAAKDHLAGGVYLSSESMDNRMVRLAKNEFLLGKYVSYDELVERLQRVTPEEVVELAGSVFRDGGLSLTTLGPFRERDLDKSHLWIG